MKPRLQTVSVTVLFMWEKVYLVINLRHVSRIDVQVAEIIHDNDQADSNKK